tara:strand:+ start:254 stop:613 length:360 start_codon:yes stop_codon:yes gene_type:complete
MCHETTVIDYYYAVVGILEDIRPLVRRPRRHRGRFFFHEDDIEAIEGRAVCIWRVLRAIKERNSSLEDQYSAIRRFVEFRGIGDEANDDHNDTALIDAGAPVGLAFLIFTFMNMMKQER